MSFPAIAWALKQPVGRASAKFLLVAMADCVNADSTEMLCFPSIAHLSKVTDMDPKSVKANLLKLRELGFIEDSGERKGQTGRVVTYRLKSPDDAASKAADEAPQSAQISLVIGPNFPDPDAGEISPNFPGNEPKFPDQSAQISLVIGPNFPDPDAGEISPNFPGNEPKFPDQSAQISLVIGPNLGHGTSKEPVMEPVKEPVKRAKSSFNAAEISLPDWLPREAWVMWAKDRSDRKKPITQAGAMLQLKDLEKYRAQGHDPVAVIEHSISRGWQGLFPPKEEAVRAGGSARPRLPHSGFDQIDYTKGVDENGYITL
jgi:hypothetical protein